jgi:hypothetical protein
MQRLCWTCYLTVAHRRPSSTSPLNPTCGRLWIVLARVAYASVLNVSSTWKEEGLQHATMSVRAHPPKLPMSSLVSLESLYGIWALVPAPPAPESLSLSRLITYNRNIHLCVW